MKRQPKQALRILLIVGLIAISTTACKKRRAEKDLYGSYSRDLPTAVYSDSTTQLLLLNETINFSNGGEVGEMMTGGIFAANVSYTVEKSDDPDYDLELKFVDLDYSDWLPKNYVNGSGGLIYNSVVPNTSVLDQVRFYIKTDENSIHFLMRFPSSDVIQQYSRF